MKLKFLLSISSIFAINCDKETSDSGTTTITCDDLDQNLSGIEYFNFKQFKEEKTDSLNIFSSKRQQYRSRRFGSFKTLDRIEKVTFG